MKNTLIITFALLFSGLLLAQEKKAKRKNDIMIDPILLIAGPVLNISYEHLPSKNLGVGINFLSYIGSESNEKFTQVSPFVRYYVQEYRYGSGFFIEGFMPITSNTETYTKSYYTNNMYFNENISNNIGTVGFGFGVGGKWVTKDNLVFEVSGGVARRFASSDKLDNPVTGKFMLGIGYRF